MPSALLHYREGGRSLHVRALAPLAVLPPLPCHHTTLPCYTPYHATAPYHATLSLDEVRALAPLAAGEVLTYSYLAEEQLCAPYAERAALLQVRQCVGGWVGMWAGG